MTEIRKATKWSETVAWFTFVDVDEIDWCINVRLGAVLALHPLGLDPVPVHGADQLDAVL